MRKVWSLLFVAFALMAVPAVTEALSPAVQESKPGVGAEELRARRSKLAAAIGKNAMFIALPAVTANRNGDVDFPFRQDDNLLYLTGAAMPETTLVLLPGEKTFSEALFARSRNPLTERWDGRIPPFDEVKAQTGVANVLPSSRFEAFVDAALQGRPWRDPAAPPGPRAAGMPAFSQTFREGKAEVWLLFGHRPEDGGTRELELAEKLRRRYPELRFRDATPLLVEMRHTKSPAEVALVQRAVDITVLAQKAAMRRVLTATSENQVEAAIDATYRSEGADGRGFPPIVASGKNATTLHYETNNDPIPRDGLLLCDIGAEVQGYTADVTRTFPADGTFSAEQREVYEAVLAAQDAAFPLVRSGGTQHEAQTKAQEVLGTHLLRMGLVTANTPDQVGLYFFHGLGHAVGLQVHDVTEMPQRYEINSIYAVEPGIYVRSDDVRASEIFKALPAADQEKVGAALKRYDGIGVRIEDDVLVTAGAPRVLSAAAPRTVAEIEAFMAAPQP